MQRIEFRLIYFPETNEWRLYSGESYHSLGQNLNNLQQAVAGLLESEAADIGGMVESIREADKRLPQ